MKISAVIIAFNEEEKIAEALRSVSFADEIIVVDSESTDKTRDIAENAGARVIIQKWLGFSAQKQFAIENASNDWVLSLDADERVSIELRKEIAVFRENTPSVAGFRIPRLSYYMDRAIRHGGWYPDRQLRLFDRRKGHWKPVLIHESVEMAPGSRVGKMDGDILHYSVENAAHHNRMIAERYAPLAARQMFENGKRTTKPRIVFAGWFAFVQTYFLRAGFLDGFPGFCIAKFAAHHAYMKHLLLWELQNADTPAK